MTILVICLIPIAVAAVIADAIRQHREETRDRKQREEYQALRAKRQGNP